MKERNGRTQVNPNEVLAVTEQVTDGKLRFYCWAGYSFLSAGFFM